MSGWLLTLTYIATLMAPGHFEGPGVAPHGTTQYAQHSDVVRHPFASEADCLAAGAKMKAAATGSHTIIYRCTALP